MKACAQWIQALVLGGALAAAQHAAAQSAGLPGYLRDRVLPGSELEVAPADSLAPLVLRIAGARRHGDAWRYDFEYWAREAGEYDLRDFLRRADGTSLFEGADALPALPVSIGSLLPQGLVPPHEPQAGRAPVLGGYRRLLAAAAVLWVAGLLAILATGQRRRRAALAAERPQSLDEVLRPLVERALAGSLSSGERAQLELGLVALWRHRLALEELRPEDVIERLRAHPEAGRLLASLEAWLHRPEASRDVDLGTLLAPYRDLPADALERAAAAT